MKIEAQTVQEYLNKIPEERKPAFEKLRNVILNNIPVNIKPSTIVAAIIPIV